MIGERAFLDEPGRERQVIPEGVHRAHSVMQCVNCPGGPLGDKDGRRHHGQYPATDSGVGYRVPARRVTGLAMTRRLQPPVQPPGNRADDGEGYGHGEAVERVHGTQQLHHAHHCAHRQDDAGKDGGGA